MEGFKNEEPANTDSGSKGNLAKTLLVASALLANPMPSTEAQQHSRHTGQPAARHSTEHVAPTIDSSRSTLVSHDTLHKEITAIYRQDSSALHPAATREALDSSDIDRAPLPAQETKETRAAAPAAPEKILETRNESKILPLDQFTASFKEMITSTLKEKNPSATLDSVHIDRQGSHLAFYAVIATHGLDIKITGNIVPNGNSLSIAKPEIDAKFFIQGRAKEQILPLLETIFEKYEHVESEKLGKEIDSMSIEPSGVKLHFKS